MSMARERVHPTHRDMERGAMPSGRARRVIASFEDYADAERAVDALADTKFPVEKVSVVGQGLQYVEQVVDRMTMAKAALRGALTGALTGALIGWLFAVFDWFDPSLARLWLIIDGLWFGTLVGALFGLVAHAMTGGRRDFVSVPVLRAERYELLVDDDVGDEAVRLLDRSMRTTEDPTAPSR
jgi:hypothetical protein